MIEAIRRFLARRGRVVLAIAVVGITAFQAGRAFRAERAVTGGEICLPLDDSFIYLQYARAIAEGHPFVYTPGNAPTTGATSLGYPLLLAPPHLLRLSPALCVGWAIALGLAGYVLSALLMARLGTKLGGPGAGALAIVLFLASPYLLWGYLSGMEIALYATVLLATTIAYLKEREAALFPTFRWWVFALAGSRPEGAILCGVLGLLAIVDRRRASRRPGGPPAWAPELLLPFAAAALPFLVNLAVSGSIESTSSQAKSILAEPYLETRRKYLLEAPQVWRDIGKVYLGMMHLVNRDEVPPAFAWVNGGGAALFALFAFVPRRRPWPAGGAILLLIAAGIVVNSIPINWQVHLFRYQQGLYPLVLALFAAGWGRLAWLAWTRAPRFLGAPVAAAALVAPLAIWAPGALPEQGRMLNFYAHNCENILHQQVRIGRWIDRNLPRGAVVGLNDAGAIAYYGRRSTVDLVGLTSAGYARVYRSGLGCLFEHVRRQPPDRTPTYFAIYPDWFVYWPESGILGPEAFRAHLVVNTICGGTDMVVYPATWIDARATDRPALDPPERSGFALVDSLDLAWLEDERAHEWKAEPQAKDVLRQYAYSDRPTRPLTDGGRIVYGTERFRARVIPGKDLLMVVRTDAWYPNWIRVTVDGAEAGVFAVTRSESAWVEPRFPIPGSFLKRDRPEFTIAREDRSSNGNFAPFHIWLYQ
ncbi:MAG TPA: hypothetical protein VF363_11545 [Candidatus Eisenbacteria bacterium]